jgi:malate dehydrogenase (oxaloacetate-decarboxylating)
MSSASSKFPQNAGGAPYEKYSHLDLYASGSHDCALSGTALLQTPYFNKGSAFTIEERRAFDLEGLLPASVQRLEQQVKRAYEQFLTRHDDLAKNTFLSSMREQNEVLFYKLVHDNIKEMMPIVYTPTEGLAIENYSRIFRRPEGCFLKINNPERVEHDLAQWGGPEDVDYIVVTDGEEILGIGDQGAGGILISVAKLVLTSLCAGIHPNRTLAVGLDCGTDNEDLLNDDLYLGLKQRRVRGEKYDDFIDTFVRSARKLYPKAYIHFEDFGLPNARRILDKYRPEMACFNDDVQGTGCVTLAALYAACHVTKNKIQDSRIVIFGAGTAGTGIADQMCDAIATESGKSKEEAAKQIWCVDKPGLLLKSHGDKLTIAQKPYARDDDEWNGKNHSDLLSVVKEVKPHILIGTSTHPGSFTKEVVQFMASYQEHPIIFPLSNPTRLQEAEPKDLIEWTEGKVLMATGSPAPPVEWNGEKSDVAECNNSTTFPGIGLGCVLSRTKRLSDGMLVAAVKALASKAPCMEDPKKPLLPDVEDVREISVGIAMAVIKQAVEEGLAQVDGIPEEDGDLEMWVRAQMWEPKYRPLKKVSKEEASRHARGELGIAGKAAQE